MDVRFILGIVIALIVAPIGLAIGSTVSFQTTDAIDTSEGNTSYSFAENDGQFAENLENADTDWTTESTDNHPIKWDGTNEWAYVTGVTLDNSTHESTDNIEQVVNISLHSELNSATVSWAWQIADNENLTDLDLYVELKDPSGNWSTVYQQKDNTVKDTSWETYENDVASIIDESGSWTVGLSTHIKTDDNDSAQVNWDNVEFEVKTTSYGYLENTIGDVEENTNTGFSLGSLLPLVIAAVGLISAIVVGFYGLYGRTK